MFIVVLSCLGAHIVVRYGSLNAIFAKIAQARLKVDPVSRDDEMNGEDLKIHENGRNCQ